MKYIKLRDVVRCTLAALAVYVMTYLYFSRCGYAEQDIYSGLGFYYSSPYNGGASGSHEFCRWLYSPLQSFERWMGSTRSPALWPLMMNSDTM